MLVGWLVDSCPVFELSCVFSQVGLSSWSRIQEIVFLIVLHSGHSIYPNVDNYSIRYFSSTSITGYQSPSSLSSLWVFGCGWGRFLCIVIGITSYLL